VRWERWLYTIPLRLRSIFRRSRVEAELSEELQFHLEQRALGEMAAGKTAEEARYAALRAMDGLEQRKEECRDMRGVRVLDNLRGNLRYAVRALKRTPGFTAVAMITLALGIGANTAIFSLVDAVMLKLLPVKAPEQLYFVQRQGGHFASWSGNYPDYRAMREHNTVFEGLAAYSGFLDPLGIQGGGADGRGADLAHGIFVSGNYFEILGVSPALGHLFNSADDRAPGAAPFTVLSYAYWKSHFGGDTQAIGRKVFLNGYPLTVIGVTPRGFEGADMAIQPDFFLPIVMRSQVNHTPEAMWNHRHNNWIATIGRLKPGVSLSRAEGELYAICKDQEAAEKRTGQDPRGAQPANPIVLVPAGKGFSPYGQQLKKPLVILFVVVVLVLLIACANIANLMITRGAARQREIAIRLAIGASRRHVITQLLTESMLIAGLGGAAGILVALVGTHVLTGFIPQASWPISGVQVALDWRVLGFMTAVSVVTGLLFGIAPAFQSTRPDLIPALKEDLPGSSGTTRFTLKKGLVILQVGLSLPLLVGAVLFARTLGNLRGIDTGFKAENVFVASVDPTRFGYQGQRARDFYDRLAAHVAALPGVRVATLALMTPLSGSSWTDAVTVEGYSGKSREGDVVGFDAVGPRYFEALGTPLLLGRDFVEHDNPAKVIEMPDMFIPGEPQPVQGGPHVAIVNEAFVRRYSPRGAIGLHVATKGTSSNASYEIVGVVKDQYFLGLREAVEPMVFLPAWQNSAGWRQLVIRTTGSERQLGELLRREIHQLDPVVPLLNVHALKEDVDQTILVERLVATLSGFFGLVAVLLSAVGLYGVVSYSVTRRTREIGIRMALGAGRDSILRLVLGDVIAMVLAGAVIGTAIAFAASRAVASLLYGVSAADPLTLIAAGVGLAVTALCATFLPARRAIGVDPNSALRYE
jgi:predicted permease